jgi:hypothetical protein
VGIALTWLLGVFLAFPLRQGIAFVAVGQGFARCGRRLRLGHEQRRYVGDHCRGDRGTVPDPPGVVAGILDELRIAAAATDETEHESRRVALIQRPWDPPSCPPEIRRNVYADAER